MYIHGKPKSREISTRIPSEGIRKEKKKKRHDNGQVTKSMKLRNCG